MVLDEQKGQVWIPDLGEKGHGEVAEKKPLPSLFNSWSEANLIKKSFKRNNQETFNAVSTKSYLQNVTAVWYIKLLVKISFSEVYCQ